MEGGFQRKHLRAQLHKDFVSSGLRPNMFRGITNLNLDTKGRCAIPTRYRDALCINGKANHYDLVITIDTESPCLLLYPALEWSVIENKLQALPSFNPATRRIQRLLIGHATELELDVNSRLIIPPVLREYASLDKKIMLVGQGKKFEIWDETIWNERRQQWLAEESRQSEIPPELKDISL
jgi:MraZ protein